ncbi:MAG: hypothetical protein ACFFB3_24440 [Candidatus Hodarchaeota archaeon]
MLEAKYDLSDELRVVRQPDGSEQVGVRRTVSAPSEALEGHIEAVRDYEQILLELKDRFVEKVDSHKTEIREELDHVRFFNQEFGKNQWDHNQMFDRLRIQYINKESGLKKELRGLELKEIDSLKGFAKELRDAKSEISPFKRFI